MCASATLCTAVGFVVGAVLFIIEGQSAMMEHFIGVLNHANGCEDGRM